MRASTIALALGLALLPAAAHAAGEETTAETPAVVDPWTAKWGDLGPDYAAARALVEAGDYEKAIAALGALGKMEDPRVLNWLGFSSRKLGRTDEAVDFYQKALTIAPEFTPAHEYLGEAWLQEKDIAKAKEELKAIETLCGGTSCEEYEDLAKSIAAAE